MSYIPSPSILNSNPNEPIYKEYVCPPYPQGGSIKEIELHEQKLLAWVRRCREEGEAYFKSCRAYESLDTVLDILCGKINLQAPAEKLSLIFLNTIKRNIKEMIATLANIRPSWYYEANSTKDPNLLKQARIQNGLSDDWYRRRFIDREIKKMLQWALPEGTSYISPVWNPHLDGLNQGNIEIKHYRYNQVYPTQLGPEFDLQRAYTVTMEEETPYLRVCKMFPHKAHLIRPDRGMVKVNSLFQSGVRVVTDAIGAIRQADQKKPNQTHPSPVTDVFYTYVDDFSTNRLDYPIPMGEGNNWGYIVPVKGDKILSHYTSSGEPVLKTATFEDCYLYPNRRLIISTNTCILYDGPSFWWHGKVPIIKYSPDSWVFSYLGFSVVSEVLSLEKSSINMRRAVEDALQLSIDPPLVVDEISVAKSKAGSNSIRTPGKRIRGKLQMGDFIKPILPPTSYKVGMEHFNYIQEVEDKIAYIMGVPDLKELQKANQIPSADSIEKFFQQAGAIVTDMSRSMDPVVCQMADMNRYYFFQFYDLAKRIRILGEDGITPEDYDFEPGTLIPTSLPYEPLSTDGTSIISSTYVQRVKHHINSFSTAIHPTSLHQITNMARKLLRMQASKVNPLLISAETIAKDLDIENWGHLEGDTELEKKMSELKIMQQQQNQALFAQGIVSLILQQLAQQNSPEAALGEGASQLAEALKGGIEGGGEGGAGGVATGGAPVGRPPSFNNEPRQVIKDGGTRSIVAT